MRYFRLIMIIVALPAVSVFSQKEVRYVIPPDSIINEFRYLGNTLVCISDTLEPGYLSCLHIGDIEIGSSRNEIESKYNKIFKIIPESEKIESRVYVLNSDTETLPYVVVKYKDQKAISIQLTGLKTSDDISFSNIVLSDSENKVIEVLGKPREKVTEVDIDGVRWSYDPFPISIEFVNRKVYSIKIWLQ
jgi:hypothetical protein